MCRIETCTRDDFDTIVTNHGVYWDSDLTLALHHPLLIHEFGDTAYVARDGVTIAGYLFGFFAQQAGHAYVHLVAVHPRYRGRGLGRRLYAHFMQQARRQGCTALKATAAPANVASIRFHRALGMRMLGRADRDGVTVVRDYLKPGVDRVVFYRPL